MSRKGGDSLSSHRHMFIRMSLVDAVLGKDYATPRKKEKQVSRPIKYPDAVVLEIRRLNKYYGTSTSKIREYLLEKGFDISIGTIRGFLNYLNRTNLEPTNEKPYL